jgi:quinol monooxygenase YgiN
MAIVVMVRARLRGDVGSAQQLHDQVTGATKDMARAAGDVGHRTYLNPADPMDFLGIDEWQSAEAFQAFASNPQIAEFFGRLFDGEPEVSVWAPSAWNEW